MKEEYTLLCKEKNQLAVELEQLKARQLGTVTSKVCVGVCVHVYVCACVCVHVCGCVHVCLGGWGEICALHACLCTSCVPVHFMHCALMCTFACKFFLNTCTWSCSMLCPMSCVHTEGKCVYGYM